MERKERKKEKKEKRKEGKGEKKEKKRKKRKEKKKQRKERKETKKKMYCDSYRKILNLNLLGTIKQKYKTYIKSNNLKARG